MGKGSFKKSNGMSAAMVESPASSILPGRFHWIVMLLVSTGMAMWN